MLPGFEILVTSWNYILTVWWIAFADMVERLKSLIFKDITKKWKWMSSGHL